MGIFHPMNWQQHRRIADARRIKRSNHKDG
jgi:hypothetical protein